MEKWRSDDLVADYADLIRQLRAEGLGRRAVAARITELTGRECTGGIMQTALLKLDLPTGRPEYAPVEVEDISDESPDDGEVPIEELIESRVKASQRKHIKASAHSRTLELPAEPFGIMVFGDPHVDNEGCDWGALMEHVKLVQRTEGVMAACVGDITDNWIGRLQRLYSKSCIKASDGWRLSEWLLESMQWLAIVGGNHDQWAHAPGTDPLHWISKRAKVLCYANDEIRITLTWKNRPELPPLVWLLRHDFRGRSWFHPTHGPHKEAMLDGKCHLLTAGHIHQWGQLSTEQRHERITHALRVRGYKRDDEHARALGYHEQRHGESALIILNPTVPDPGRVRVFWDLAHGCEYLTWLRDC